MRGQWRQTIAHAKLTSGRLTDDELLELEGHTGKLTGPVQERYALMLGIGDELRGSDSGPAQLEANIAARRPFLDLVYSRAHRDGSLQHFEVSAEPIFSKSGRYVG